LENLSVDLPDLSTIVRARREALGLSQSRLARLSGVSRKTLVGLEAGAPSDLGFNRVVQVLAVLAVLGLDLDPPSQAACSRKRCLWMAAKNAATHHKDLGFLAAFQLAQHGVDQAFIKQGLQSGGGFHPLIVRCGPGRA
jgi:transcriptional regulator with XRE-family HTH domain